MGYSLEFTLEGLPKLGNTWVRTNHFALRRESQTWKDMVAFSTIGKRPKLPLSKARVEFKRYSSVEPDYDGLVISFKAIMDGIVESGVLIDDKLSVTGPWDVSWEKCKPGKGKIWARISEI